MFGLVEGLGLSTKKNSDGEDWQRRKGPAGGKVLCLSLKHHHGGRLMAVV